MELKANEGVIFKNDRKTAENKQPEYKGQINCEGIIKDIALWVRKSKDGSKTFFSVKLDEPYNKTAPAKEQIQDDVPTDTDSLPF